MRCTHLDSVWGSWSVFWLWFAVYATGVLAFADLNERCNATCYTERSVCVQVAGQLGGICICIKGFRASWNGRRCVPERCSLDEHCDLENEECNKTIARCMCRAHHERRHDSQPCVPPLGRRCTSAGDCLKFVKHAQCLNGTCACEDRYLATSDSTHCHPLLGRGCSVNVHCLVKHSLCYMGKCECSREQDKFVAAANGTSCLPEVTDLRGSCSEHSQCVSGRSNGARWCINNECVCRFGFTKHDTTHCEASRALGDSCTHSQQCQMVARSVCQRGKCACESGYFPHPTGSICLSGLLGHCRSNDECFVPDDEGEQKVECRLGSCACMSGYFSSDSLSCSPQSAESASCGLCIRSWTSLALVAAVLAASLRHWLPAQGVR